MTGHFCSSILNCLQEDILYLDKTVFTLVNKVNHHTLIIWGLLNLQQVVKHTIQSEGECFLCCKQNTGLQTILFCWDYHYGSHVPWYAEAFPCSTAGSKQCDFATRSVPSPLTQGCDIILELNTPRKMKRLWQLHCMATHIEIPHSAYATTFTLWKIPTYLSYHNITGKKKQNMKWRNSMNYHRT
jgi:hypothetical protein